MRISIATQSPVITRAVHSVRKVVRGPRRLIEREQRQRFRRSAAGFILPWSTLVLDSLLEVSSSEIATLGTVGTTPPAFTCEGDGVRRGRIGEVRRLRRKGDIRRSVTLTY